MFDSKKGTLPPYRNVIYLELGNGVCPFEEWLNSLTLNDRVIIQARLTRLMNGNFGDYKSLGGGIHELRFHTGSGFRVYYALYKSSVLILYAGDKSSQRKDIRKAMKLRKDYENEN